MINQRKTSVKNPDVLTAHEKAAIIIKTLGKENALSVLSYLPDDERELLMAEIARTKHIDSETELHILKELDTLLQEHGDNPGSEFDDVKSFFETTLGKAQADIILGKIRSQLKYGDGVQRKDFDSDSQTASGNVRSLASILNHVDSEIKQTILENLENENPEFTSHIKNCMLKFEDLFLLDDNSIQRILEVINISELSVALKVASDELKDKIINNMATVIQKDITYPSPLGLSELEEMQQGIIEIVSRNINHVGPLHLNVIEEAQQRIVEVLHRLVEKQLIVTVHGKKMESYI
ncbi:FliG C-terminal domain-containing protein [Candidatus Omnitrophota bacterium]